MSVIFWDLDCKTEDGKEKMNNVMAAAKKQPLRIGEAKAAGGDVTACRGHGIEFITS